MANHASKFLALTIFASLTLAAQAQNKILSHADYDGWKAIQGISQSNDGAWILYASNPQEGDNVVEIKAIDGSKTYKIERGINVNFSEDSKFVIATVIPKFTESRDATRKKVKNEDRPKNSLVILNLTNGETTTKELVTSYQIAKKDSGFIIYRPEPPKPEPPKKEEAKPEAKPEEAKKDEPKKKKGHGEGNTIVVYNLATKEETKMDNVGTYTTNDSGAKLFYNATPKTATGHGVFVYDLKSKSTKPILEGLGQYTRITLSEDGRKIAILTDKDDYETETNPSNSVYLGDSSGIAKRIAFEGDAGIQKGWYIPSRSGLSFTRDGGRLSFSIVEKPAKEEKKEEVFDDEKVTVDIWSWTDKELQPQQLLRAAQERNRSYSALYDLTMGTITQIETPEFNTVRISRFGTGRWGQASIDLASGAGATPEEIWLIDLTSGKSKKALPAGYYTASLSPTGKWLFAYNYKTQESFVLNPDNLEKTSLTGRFLYPIHDTEDDHPFPGGPYGIAGWSEDDNTVYVYDKFDIFSVNLTTNEKAKEVTKGAGRSSNLVIRYNSIDPEEKFISPTKISYVSIFNPKTKDMGYATLKMGETKSPNILVLDAHNYSGFSKARDADVYRVQKETVSEYRDVYITNAQLANQKRVSDINPQTKEYVWPTVELVEWRSLDGEKLQGQLYRPSNFTLRQQYPMITYFYEKDSDNLHRYLSPAPSASTINIPYFVSNGYCVFVPDITYKDGYPGESAMSAIVSGVNSIVDRGFIDPKRLGIQGQSWGGYQVGYLVTETNMFACASAGALVSNMFSAYGGIRYGSGLVRQLQYETGQSRIGGTMWEYPMRYWENSPIFFVDKVKTPLLMMANDADGSVPWTQGVEYFTALHRLGKPAWLINYNGEDHNLIQRKNRKDLSIRLAQFFDHYLKGAPMPVWMADGIPASKKGTTMGTELTGGGEKSKQTGGN